MFSQCRDLIQVIDYLHVGIISSSISRVHREYSNWTAVMGCTEWARRMSAAEASDNPKYFTFPSSTSSFIAPTYISFTIKTLRIHEEITQIKATTCR